MSKIYEYIDDLQAGDILKQMWQESGTDQFSDVVLIAGGEEIKIPAHRNVLSTATGYFKKMFTSLGESREKEVKIPSVDGHALKSIIQFIYTGRVKIMEDNVVGLLKTADMLLLNNAVLACGKLLVYQLDSYNCLELTRLAERFHCQSLLEYAEEYTLEHFMDVYKTQKFLQLSSEQLCQLLANDNLLVASEEHVFKSLLLWLEHDRCEHEKYKDKLLKLVRMPLLEPMFLDNHVKPVCTSTASLQLYIEAKEWQSLQNPSLLSPSSLLKPRRPSQYLVGIGIADTYDKLYIHYYCQQRLKWLRWKNYLEDRSEFAFATMGHNLYIAGGHDDNGNIFNTVICLNMKTMTISPVKAMIERRRGCRAVALNGFLYVVGGCDRITDVAYVERLDPKTNVWSKVASMLAGRCEFGLAELNMKLYAFGGINYNGARILAESYDSNKDVWTAITSIHESRMVTVANGLIYSLCDLRTVRCYDPVTNQWSIIARLKKSIPNYTVFTTFQDKVIVCYEDHVDEYDATTNEWKTIESSKGFFPHLKWIFSYSGQLLTTNFAEKNYCRKRKLYT